MAISNVHQAHRLSQQLQEKRNQALAKLKASSLAKRASQANKKQQSPPTRELPPLQASVTPIQGFDSDLLHQDQYEDDDSIDSNMAKLKKGEMIVKERDFKRMEDDLANCKDELAKSEEKSTKAQRDLAAVVEQKKALNMEIASLKTQVTTAKAGVSAKKALEMEQSKDICAFITQYMKDVVYRNTKFATKDKEKENLSRKIYDALQATFSHDNTVKDLSFPEFRRIYEPFILSDLSLRRQYSQSCMQNVCHGKFWLRLRLIQEPTNP